MSAESCAAKGMNLNAENSTLFPPAYRLFSAIDRLVGGLELVAARLLSTRKVGTISSSEGILTDNGSTSSSGGSSQSSSVRVVEIVMHHVDLKWLLETVASAVGECWKAGRPVTSQSHPISLAVRSTEKHWWVTSAKRTKQMYADGREWLKGHAGGGAG